MPRVSVVIPVYNQSRFVGEAVQSALAQTLADREVIVVDDGSSDGPRQVLTEFLSRIVFLRQSNQGRSMARNNGLERARGEFVAFLDADDVWEPDFLERQSAVMESHSDVGLSFSAALEADETGKPVRVEYREIPALQDRRQRVLSILTSNPTRTSACLFRRAVLPREAFDPRLSSAEDWDLLLRIAMKHPVFYLKEPLYRYRLHRERRYPELIKRGREEARLRILERAYGCLEDEISVELMNRLWARTCFENACLRCAVGDAPRAREWLEEALQRDREFFTLPATELVNCFGEFLETLYHFGTPRSEARQVVDRFFQEIPPSLEPLRSLQRRVMGHFLGAHAFGSYQRGEPGEALISALNAVLKSPGWLCNRGFLSLAARSALGRTRVLP